jgi:hypothetical protein
MFYELQQWGPKKCQLLATPCVALSLALISLDYLDSSGSFLLRTLSVYSPLNNCGACFVYGYRFP